MDLTLFLIVAVAFAAVALLAGVLLGRARKGALADNARNELEVARGQLESLEGERNRAVAASDRRVAEERAVGSERLGEARREAEAQLSSAHSSWELRLSVLKGEHASELKAQESAAASRYSDRDREHLNRAAQASSAHDRQLEEIRAVHVGVIGDLKSAADAHLKSVKDALELQAETERDRHIERVAELKAEADLRVVEAQEQAKRQIDELRLDQKRLADEFEALSRQALATNSKQFMEHAEERFKRAQEAGQAAFEQRETAVKQMVEPIAKSLESVKQEVTNAEKARGEATAALTEQLHTMRRSSDQLTTETRQLVTALRAPQVRGRWGELQLRRVVEAAGMLNHVDFVEQESVRTDDGLRRPDLVVRLSGGKQVVVDSKVAFHGYLEALEARDDQTRAIKLTAHARHLRKHIDDLSSKAYWEVVDGTPEFVVMFVPAEPFLTAALDEDPTLFEHAFAKNVVIATPSTLVALLRTVGYAWRQERLAGEAQQIHEVGRELHKRLGIVGGHLQTLAKRLNSTVTAYNSFANSLDRNVVTQARRFSELQGVPEAFEAPVLVESLAVAPQKSDLYNEEVTDTEPVAELER